MVLDNSKIIFQFAFRVDQRSPETPLRLVLSWLGLPFVRCSYRPDDGSPGSVTQLLSTSVHTWSAVASSGGRLTSGQLSHFLASQYNVLVAPNLTCLPVI